MATNFEFYKDEILKITSKNKRVAIEEGKIVVCEDLGSCARCYFHGGCEKKHFQWLYAEHVEAPKLTKRERAFCEAMQTGWISGLYKVAVFSNKKPSNVKYENGKSLFFKVGNESFAIPYKLFNWMKKNEVWAVEDLLKLDVIEEVQEDA